MSDDKQVFMELLEENCDKIETVLLGETDYVSEKQEVDKGTFKMEFSYVGEPHRFDVRSEGQYELRLIANLDDSTHISSLDTMFHEIIDESLPDRNSRVSHDYIGQPPYSRLKEYMTEEEAEEYLL